MVDDTVDQKSVDSIFLGFESETRDEKLDEKPVDESDETVMSKSAGPSVATAESDLGPSVEHLWSFQCPMTKGYCVTSVDWNRTNHVRYAVILLLLRRRERLQSIVMSTSVCLCLSVCEAISLTTRDIFTKFLCMLPMCLTSLMRLIIANWTVPCSGTRQRQTLDCKRWTSSIYRPRSGSVLSVLWMT